MTMIYCSGCDQEKEATEFAFKNKARGTLQRWCRVCQAAANRKHYLNNKQIYITRAITRQQSIVEGNRNRIHTYLSTHPCIDCGNTDIHALKFDYVQETKGKSIVQQMHDAVSWSIIENEIAKCEVRCANCHRIKSCERGGNWWRALGIEQANSTAPAPSAPAPSTYTSAAYGHRA